MEKNTLKKIFVTTFILTILISACGSSIPTTAPNASESTSTATQVPAISTVTEIPPIPPTITPTPVLSLPVSQLTPVPSSNTKISAENVQNLQEIAKYYGEINYIAKLTKDNKFLFILDPDGLTKYDYSSMEKLVTIPLLNKVSDLQISNDGGLLLVDNNWLLDLKNDKEPNLFVLSEKINLLNFSTTYSLSPDGSMIAVAQSSCPNTCEYVFRIVSTEDFKDLYTSSGLTSRRLSTFSSDGKYFAAADLLTVETSGGGTEPAGGTVGIWNTSDFTKVSSFPVEYPFYVTGIAFSEDSSKIAIAQRTAIDIYNVTSGNSKVTIVDLCDSYERKVLFLPSSTDRLLENSECGSGVWSISESTARSSGSNVPNLSRISFDENGNFKAIPYVYPTTSNLRAYRDQYYLKFLNNDILGFKNFDLETLDRHSCDLSLANGSLDCQSHAPENNNGRYLGKDVILATDGKYYGYTVGNDKVDIYPIENPTQVYYSIPFRDYIFSLKALDPINGIVIYEGSNRIIIQDMQNDRVLEKWEGETFLSSIVFSENAKFAALCRTVGYTNRPNKDRLVIFDLSEKRTVFNTEFTCSGTALGMSDDGSKLAVEHYLYNPTTDQLYSTRAVILNTASPFEKQYLEFDTLFSYATAFSPDGSMLAVSCSKHEICFLDPSDGREIYRMKAHSGISNLAFSKDGSVLATSSNWGLISLWAVPPFTNNARQSQSSPISSYIPNFSWDFNQDGWFEGWGEQDWQSAGLKDLKVKSGYLSATVTSSAPFLHTNADLDIDANKFSRIEIRMRVSAGESAQVFFTYGDGDWTEDKGKSFSIIAGTEFNTYIIDLSNVTTWKGIIGQLRLDPVYDFPSTTIEIDYIRLLP
jgi:hypothetical protein